MIEATVTDVAVDAYSAGVLAFVNAEHEAGRPVPDVRAGIRAGLAAAYEFLPIRGCNGHDGCTCYQRGVRDGLEAAGTTC